ncbi:G-protein coupled receptor [Biomphalaria pfeifferi]|uniref:G-protein coupled receptor n=1 Tax=Biomphalaria pfeifferi TaxID=112525 RepID=A0AAD8FI41_BIOPF|nr:G-protein coupled receptor [Biomphalaria pfeifferi]
MATGNVGNESIANLTETTFLKNDNSLYCFRGSLDYIQQFQLFLCFINPVFALIGLILNIFSMIILHKHQLKKPSNLLLFALVIADTMNMMVNLNFSYMLKYFGPVKTKPGYCTWEYGITANTIIFGYYELCYFIGTWGRGVNATIPVLITLERALAVFLPVTFTKMVTARSALVSCSLAYIGWLIWNCFAVSIGKVVHIEVSSGKFVSYNTATDFFLQNYALIYIFFLYFVESLGSWVPICLVIVGCIAIGIRVRVSLLRRKRLSGIKAKLKWSPRTTRTLVTTCLIFAVTHTVTSFISAFMSISDTTPVLTYFLTYLAEFINLINCSSNFFVYVLWNRHLWEIFKGLIRWPKK